MIRPGVLLAAIGSLVFLWHECGQDAGVFCYRIGWGAVRGCAHTLLCQRARGHPFIFAF